MPGDPDLDGYWQAYPDLVGLVARGHWGRAELADHWQRFGSIEGRRRSRAADIPADWSDWLCFTDWHDGFAWWWRKGVLTTGAYAALAGDPRAVQAGRISENLRMQDLTGLPPPARRDLARHGRDHPGSGPLSGVTTAPLRWSRGEEGLLLPLIDHIRARFPGPIGHVTVLSWLQVGGAERVGLWHHEAAEAAGHPALILLADHEDVAPSEAGRAAGVVNIPLIARTEFGVDYRALPAEARAELLAGLVAALSPRVLHIVHSYTAYLALTLPGPAARIRAGAGRIHVSTFCPHLHPQGIVDGYFRFIPDIAPLVDRFVFDNSWYLDEMRQTFALPEQKLALLAYPVRRIEPVDLDRSRASNRVLWASRLDAQKNPAIVAEIARRLPALEFLVYGQEVLGDAALDWSRMPPNVLRMGEFTSPDELPLEGVIAFLYTSRFDGMPNIVLEVGARGVPVVCPRVGGIGDYLGHDWMFYARHADDAESYAVFLDQLHRSPDLRRLAAQRLIALARADRTVAHFNAAAAELLPEAE